MTFILKQHPDLDGGAGPRGELKLPLVFFVLLAVCIFLHSADGLAADQSVIQSADQSVDHFLLSTQYPFVPRDTDYSLELGAMSAKQSLYWAGANVGRHVGRCILSGSQTCQQYLDLIGGVGGRDGETDGVFLGSVRWQFINFPRSWSPLFRIFGGAINAHTESAKAWHLVTGAGVGFTMYLHDRVDIRLESRLGYADRPIGQTMIAVQVKSDRLLAYFASKLAALGIATVETAIEATGAAIKGVTAPFRDSEKAAAQVQNPAPTPASSGQGSK